MQFLAAKSLPSITGLVWLVHTMNFCVKERPFILNYIYIKSTLGKSYGNNTGPCSHDNSWKSILGEIEVERLKSLEAHTAH